MAGDVRDGPHPPAQGAAAQVLLRRARLGAVRPHHHAAGVLPHALRARDPQPPRAGDRRPLARRAELVELGSGMASKTRALLYAMAGQGTLERYVPFDVDESVVDACAAELVEIYPGLEVHGVVGDFGRDLEQDPRRHGGGCSPSWAGRSATSIPSERALFLRDCAPLMEPRATGCHRHRPRQGPRGARGRLQRQRRRDRRVQPQRAAGDQRRARRRLRSRRPSSTWPSSTRPSPGSRCACARTARRRCASTAPTSR